MSKENKTPSINKKTCKMFLKSSGVKTSADAILALQAEINSFAVVVVTSASQITISDKRKTISEVDVKSAVSKLLGNTTAQTTTEKMAVDEDDEDVDESEDEDDEESEDEDDSI